MSLMTIWWAFKWARDYEPPPPATNGAEYWVGAFAMLFAPFGILPLGLWQAAGIIIATGLAVIFVAPVYWISRWSRWQRTRVPALWAKSVYWVAVSCQLLGFLVMMFAHFRPEPVAFALDVFLWLLGFAVIPLSVLVLHAMVRTNAKGPANGEASATETESGKTTG